MYTQTEIETMEKEAVEFIKQRLTDAFEALGTRHVKDQLYPVYAAIWDVEAVFCDTFGDAENDD